MAVTILTNSNASSARALTGNYEPATIDKPVTKAPDYQGIVGRAWRADLAAMRKQAGVPADQDGTLAVWIIEAPWAHPAWHSYALVLVHLRPMTPPIATKMYLDGATHEMWLYAFDPDKDREKALVDIKECARGWMTPMNFGAQLKLESDEAAIKMLELKAVEPIIHGTLSPDSDYTRAWGAIFGDNMLLDR